MNKKKLTEALQTIAEKAGKEHLTTQDKETVLKATAKYGIPFEPKSGCQSCWGDAAMQCLIAMKNEQAKTEAETDERQYILRPDVDVFFGRVRINEATLTDELAEILIANGFDKKFFVKCK